MNFKLSILALFFLNFLGKAQEILTLDKAINYALKHKADAIKAKLDYENTQYQIEQVRAAALPQINANGSLTYNPMLQQINFMGMTAKMGTPWQTTIGASVTQQIFNQSIFTGLKAAKTTKEFYAINQQLTNETLIEKVATNYYQVYQTQQQLATIENNLNSTTKTRDVLAGLFQNGLAKKIDLDRMNVSINNLNANRQLIINALQLQEHSLKFMIGMDINTPITMPENTFEINQLLINNDFDLNNRTEIKQINKQLELLLLDKKSKIAEYYPTLALTANIAYSGTADVFPWFSKHQNTHYFTSSAIGLSLSVPIFNGFSTRAKIRQADINIKKAEAEKRNIELALNLDIENAKTQINNSLLTINTQKENVDLAKNVLENTQSNYKFGLATLTDLLDAEKAYADSQNNYTNALLEYKLAEIKLIKAKGEINTLTKLKN